jgi:hypothetical protein
VWGELDLRGIEDPQKKKGIMGAEDTRWGECVPSQCFVAEITDGMHSVAMRKIMTHALSSVFCASVRRFHT